MIEDPKPFSFRSPLVIFPRREDLGEPEDKGAQYAGGISYLDYTRVDLGHQGTSLSVSGFNTLFLLFYGVF
jgi:hypothetical protein